MVVNEQILPSYEYSFTQLLYCPCSCCQSLWDSVLSFWVEANVEQVVLIVCLYLYCHWRANYHEGKGWEAIDLFNPARHCVCLSQEEFEDTKGLIMARISKVICSSLFYFQWLVIRGSCLFCWFGGIVDHHGTFLSWNCWPSRNFLVVELLTITELSCHKLYLSICETALWILILWLIDIIVVFNATFNNISAISWRPVLVVEEAGVPAENHQPWASNW